MKSIASEVKSGQIDEICRVAESCAKNAMSKALEQLVTDGEIAVDGAQRVIGRGDRLKVLMIIAYKAAVRELSQQVMNHLRLVSGGTTLTLKATSGQETIAQSKGIFDWIDPDFVNYGCDVAGEAKPEMSVEVHEMMIDGDFQKIFGSFDAELDKLALTQEQIIGFVADHSAWLCTDGRSTFFLFKAKIEGEENFFVAFMGLYDEDFSVYVYRLSNGYNWSGDQHHRVVVSKLVPGS